MTIPDIHPNPQPTNALQLRQQSYMLQAGLMRPPALEEAETSLSMKDLWRMVMRHKWILLGAMVLTTAASLVQWMTTVPVYQATTVLQIDRVARIVQFNKDVDPYQDDDYLMLQTTQELLRSRSLAERVVDDLQLAPRKPASTVAGAGSSKEDPVRDGVVAGLMGATIVEPPKSSRLIRVKVNHTDPAQAAKIANALGHSFISMTIERRMQSSEYARTFLDEQIKQTKAKLEESERSLNDYAKQNSILTLDEKTNVISQTYTDYSSALGKVEQERLRIEAVYNSVAANPESATQVMDSKTVQTYKEQKTKYETEYMNNLALYKPEFPKMVQLKAQIAELDAKIKAEAGGVLASLKAQLDAVKRQEDQVRARLQDTRRSVLVSQDKGVDYNLLKRELDTNRQMYDSLLQRMKEVSVTSGVTSNNISIVDEAKLPQSPIAPNFNKSLSVGLVAGLVLGLVIALIRENLDDSIKRSEDVEAKLHLPLLGIIPLLKKKQFTVASLGLLSHIDPRGLFSEAYRSTRTALQFSTAEGAPKRLMVTSSVQGEGKSTTALSLAINFAQMGQKVLIIDADMRSPTLHSTLSRSNELGLSAYLSGDANREALIQDTDIRNLAVLVAGPHPPSPVDLLIGPRFMELLDRAEAMGFDRIVIDAPPVLGIADAIVLGNQVQNILFAIKSASTKMSNIRDALRRMRLSGLLPLGVVLTSVSPVEAGYDTYGYGVYGAENAKTDPSNQLTA